MVETVEEGRERKPKRRAVVQCFRGRPVGWGGGGENVSQRPQPTFLQRKSAPKNGQEGGMREAAQEEKNVGQKRKFGVQFASDHAQASVDNA